MQHFSANQVSTLLASAQSNVQLLDVREQWEYEICHLPGSIHIPIAQLAERLNELDSNKTTIVVCHHGIRSYKIAVYLEQAGWADVINLTGGVEAWSTSVDPSLQRY